MIYQLARLLQLAGLVILPVAVMGNVSERISLKDSLYLSAAGMLLFFVGWLLQQGEKPQ
jgi:hypothetical protein